MKQADATRGQTDTAKNENSEVHMGDQNNDKVATEQPKTQSEHASTPTDGETPTPYDDAYRSLVQKVPNGFKPLAVYLFGRYFRAFDAVRPSDTAQVGTIWAQGSDAHTKYSDSCLGFLRNGTVGGILISELQSAADKDMDERLADYGLRRARLQVRTAKEVILPHCCTIYLRSTRNAPNAYTFKLRHGDLTLTWTMPTLKVDRLSADEILDNHLFVLVPFHLFHYERRFSKIENDSEALDALSKEYERIWETLEKANLSAYEKSVIVQLTDFVADHLASKYPNILKGVNKMRGNVLTLEIDKAIADAKAEGIRGIIWTAKKYGAPNDAIEQDLMDSMHISQAQAASWLQRYDAGELSGV